MAAILAATGHDTASILAATGRSERWLAYLRREPTWQRLVEDAQAALRDSTLAILIGASEKAAKMLVELMQAGDRAAVDSLLDRVMGRASQQTILSGGDRPVQIDVLPSDHPAVRAAEAAALAALVEPADLGDQQRPALE